MSKGSGHWSSRMKETHIGKSPQNGSQVLLLEPRVASQSPNGSQHTGNSPAVPQDYPDDDEQLSIWTDSQLLNAQDRFQHYLYAKT